MLRVSEDGRRRREGFVASYRQLGKSLLDLEEAADRIFDTISARVAEERGKLEEISVRIRKAQVEVDALSQSKHPLVIKSPSRYPSNSNRKEDFHPLFGCKSGQTDALLPVSNILVNGGLNREFGLDGTLELFQFFLEANAGSHLNDAHSKVGNTHGASREDTALENLFEMEKYIADSFQTDDSPISKPKHRDLPPPPPSLLNLSKRVTSEDFRFRPD